MIEKLCRFGILSTAGIARKNWKAIHLSGNARVSAVASRSYDAARRFIADCSTEVPPVEPPKAFGCYEEMLESDEVDAVYVPVPTGLRRDWVVKAAEAGKHVIGEKPAALDAAQVQEMIDACRQHQVQYMDGVMFMHSLRLPMVRKVMEEIPLGPIRRLASQFCFSGGDDFERQNIRMDSRLEPYGCLGDLGWYNIRFCNWLRGEQMPALVRGRVLQWMQGPTSPGKVPGEFDAELIYDDGSSATFYNSFRTQHQQWVHVSGTSGTLEIDDFVLPYRGSELRVRTTHDHFRVENCTFHMENHIKHFAVDEYDAGHHTAQEVRMFRAFADAVLSGKLNDDWPQWALSTQRITDACFKSALNDGAAVSLC